MGIGGCEPAGARVGGDEGIPNREKALPYLWRSKISFARFSQTSFELYLVIFLFIFIF